MLFIGHADRLDVPDVPARFATAGEPGCFAYRKVARDSPVRRASAAPTPAPTMPMLMLPEPEPMRMLPMPGPAPSAGSRPNRSSPPPPSPSLLDQAAELANRGRYDEAIAACERHLRLKGPGAPAYYLMGMIRQAAGDRRRAEECFHKTIYLDPGTTRRCWPWRCWPTPRRPRRGRRLPPPRPTARAGPAPGGPRVNRRYQ